MANKNVINKKYWTYFAPDGHIQVRSIADTKSLCREMICRGDKYGIDYKSYEKAGFTLQRINFTAEIIK